MTAPPNAGFGHDRTVLDQDTWYGTDDRRWELIDGAGSWVPAGTFHAVDSAHRQAECGVLCPYKWGELPPPLGAQVCLFCLGPGRRSQRARGSQALDIGPARIDRDAAQCHGPPARRSCGRSAIAQRRAEALSPV